MRRPHGRTTAGRKGSNHARRPGEGDDPPHRERRHAAAQARRHFFLKKTKHLGHSDGERERPQTKLPPPPLVAGTMTRRDPPLSQVTNEPTTLMCEGVCTQKVIQRRHGWDKKHCPSKKNNRLSASLRRARQATIDAAFLQAREGHETRKAVILCHRSAFRSSAGATALRHRLPRTWREMIRIHVEARAARLRPRSPCPPIEACPGR